MDLRFSPGARFGKYEIVSLLGEGGMGLVYEALHVDLKKRVAIKTLAAALASVPEATVRFRREGEAAARIRHPNVVDVTDVGVEAGIPYLVMEYLEGQTLGFYLNRKAPLSVTETADLALPIIAAVSAGHDAGVIHRDLKPSNIFLVADRMRRESIPKVLDFGVSKLADAQGGSDKQALTRTGAHLGTISYMSPEQAMGAREVDARSDQYALGLILYECVTGHRAYRDDDDNTFALLRRIGDNRFESPLKLRPDLSPEFAAVLTRALAHRPKDRFESMSVFGTAILPFGSARTVMYWEGVFRRHTVPFMGTVPTDGPPAAEPASAVAATMILGGPPATVSTVDGRGAAARAGAPEAGGTQMLPLDNPPVGAPPPESRSASGLAFEAVPTTGTGRATARRWPAAVAVIVALGIGAGVWRVAGSSTSALPAGPVAASPGPGGVTNAAPVAPPPVAPSVPPPTAVTPPPVAPASSPPAALAPPAAPARTHTAAAEGDSSGKPSGHHSHVHKSPAAASGKPAAAPAAPPHVGANDAKIME
jgi:hypothetical protein